MSFGPSDPHNIEIDEFLKLDFNRVIDQLKVENDILKRRLEVMESHISKQSSRAKADTGGVKKDDGGEDKMNRIDEQKIDQLLKTVEIYKNETICLKNFIEHLTDKYNADNKYLLSQVTFNVEALKYCEDENAQLRDKIDKYKTAYADQQLKTMGCFKYLNLIKTKYEDNLEQQRVLIRLLDDRFKRYFVRHAESRDGDSFREQKLIPENWGLQEKIEYLELKFINENRDKILNRLLFENEQLRKLIENDFYESSVFHEKKRIKTSEDYYLDYLKRDSIHNRLILNEKKRLSKQKHHYSRIVHAENLEIDESNTEENAENIEEEQSETDEIIADDEDGTSTTMSDGVDGLETDLKELVESFRNTNIQDNGYKEINKDNERGAKETQNYDEDNGLVEDGFQGKAETEDRFNEETEDIRVINDIQVSSNKNDLENIKPHTEIELECSNHNPRYKNELDGFQNKVNNIRETPQSHELLVESKNNDEHNEPLKCHKKLYTDVINQLKHTRGSDTVKTHNESKPNTRRNESNIEMEPNTRQNGSNIEIKPNNRQDGSNKAIPSKEMRMIVKDTQSKDDVKAVRDNEGNNLKQKKLSKYFEHLSNAGK